MESISICKKTKIHKPKIYKNYMDNTLPLNPKKSILLLSYIQY